VAAAKLEYSPAESVVGMHIRGVVAAFKFAGAFKDASVMMVFKESRLLDVTEGFAIARMITFAASMMLPPPKHFVRSEREEKLVNEELPTVKTKSALLSRLRSPVNEILLSFCFKLTHACSVTSRISCQSECGFIPTLFATTRADSVSSSFSTSWVPLAREPDTMSKTRLPPRRSMCALARTSKGAPYETSPISGRHL